MPRTTSHPHSLLGARWRGVIHANGPQKVYQQLPRIYPHDLRKRCRKGRILASFSTMMLIDIAYSVLVPDAAGLTIVDYIQGGAEARAASITYSQRLVCMTKTALVRRIWNQLVVLGRIDNEA